MDRMSSSRTVTTSSNTEPTHAMPESGSTTKLNAQCQNFMTSDTGYANRSTGFSNDERRRIGRTGRDRPQRSDSSVPGWAAQGGIRVARLRREYRDARRRLGAANPLVNPAWEKALQEAA